MAGTNLGGFRFGFGRLCVANGANYDARPPRLLEQLDGWRVDGCGDGDGDNNGSKIYPPSLTATAAANLMGSQLLRD